VAAAARYFFPKRRFAYVRYRTAGLAVREYPSPSRKSMQPGMPGDSGWRGARRIWPWLRRSGARIGIHLRIGSHAVTESGGRRGRFSRILVPAAQLPAAASE
jgi:hypothetical protein